MSAPRHIGTTWHMLDRVPKDVSSKARGQSVAIEVDGERRSLTLGEFAKLSLKTKDAAKAKRRYHEAAAALSRHYEALRHSPTKITQQQAAALAGDYFRSLLQRHGENPGEADQWLDGMDPLIAAPPFPRADRNGLMAIIRFGFSLTFMLLSRPFGRIPWCVYTPINV